jgi:hypothetical protein
VISQFVRQISPVFCAALLAGGCCAHLYAQSSSVTSLQNRSDREVRTVPPATAANAVQREMQESLKNLPWNDLSSSAQAKIKQVVSGAPLYRRLPQQTIYADPEIYHFLIQHPDVVVGFWEQLGATQLSLREVRENYYVLKESGGTAAAIEVLHRTNDICVVYARGEYRGPLLAKPYQGDVVVILRTQFMRDDSHEPMVVCDLDAFVQINSLGADVLAKLFYTSLGKIADSNFEVTASFIEQVSKAATRSSLALKSTAEEITTIRQGVYEEFCDVVDRAAIRFSRRNQPSTLAGRQQRTPQAEFSVGNHDFLMSSFNTSTDIWTSDPFFASPKTSHERTGELNVPKTLESNHSDYTAPKLPKPAK